MSQRTATAIARSNIALAKYWGKLARPGNYPATPSLSLTLDGLTTRTTVSFSAALGADEGSLDGRALVGKELARVSAMLSEFRALAGSSLFARVDSTNAFPTAAGLASSASGFAALALAASAALGLELDPAALSAVARRASASAARSLFGGWVELATGAEHAAPLAAPEHWDVRMLVALTARGPKATGSTDGMLHTARTSPLYRAWVDAAPGIYQRLRRGVLERDLTEVGEAMEESTLCMHATMLAAAPAIIYMNPTTLAVLAAVRELRAAGVAAYATMDAGPHVKVLTSAATAQEVHAALSSVPGVQRVHGAAPGAAAELVTP